MNDAYLQPYREAQNVHGSKFDVTLWASTRTQEKRFDIFLDMVDLTGLTVLDAGCSRGDLAQYCIDKQIPFDRYIGVDGLPEVIHYAQSRELPNTEFVAGDFVGSPYLLHHGSPDVTLISGTLNTMDIDTAMTVLDAAWEGCSKTLAFNFLSDRPDIKAPDQTYPAKRLPSLQIIDWALSKTWNVQYRQDYFDLGHDATLVMTKGRGAETTLLRP